MTPKKISEINLDTLKPGDTVWVEARVSKINGSDSRPICFRICGSYAEPNPLTHKCTILTDAQVRQIPDLEGLEWVCSKDELPPDEERFSEDHVVFVNDNPRSLECNVSNYPEEWKFWLRGGRKLWQCVHSLPIAEKKDPGYGYTKEGKKIEPPEGWEIVPEGEPLPKSNLESMVFCDNDHGWREHSLASQEAGLSTYTDQWRVRAYARRKDPVAKGHNPDGLTESQVGVADGWRLLGKDEIDPKRRLGLSCRGIIEKWEILGWDDSWWSGTSCDCTYRTRKPEGYFLPDGHPDKPEPKGCITFEGVQMHRPGTDKLELYAGDPPDTGVTISAECPQEAAHTSREDSVHFYVDGKLITAFRKVGKTPGGEDLYVRQKGNDNE